MAALGVAVMGLSGGLIDASVNTDVALHNGARAMGMLHASYGVGATLGPLLVTYGLSRGDQWQPPFAVFAGIHTIVALAFLSRTSLWSNRSLPAHSPAPVGGRRRVVTLALIVFALITASETTASQFGFSFLTVERGLDETVGGLAVSGFFAGLTIARFALGAVGHRLAPTRIVTFSTFGVVAGAGLLWWSPTALLAATGLTVMGLAGGTLFPLNVLLTPQRVGSEATPRVVGWQLAAANFGGAAYPPLVGQMISSNGLGVVGPAVIVVAIALLVVAELLRRSAQI
jgi:fucose permease